MRWTSSRRGIGAEDTGRAPSRDRRHRRPAAAVLAVLAGGNRGARARIPAPRAGGTMTETTPHAAAPPTPGIPRVVVRAYPKVIFFWMTWLFSLVAALLVSDDPTKHPHLGTIWMAVFAFNLLVISFDFTEVISLLT